MSYTVDGRDTAGSGMTEVASGFAADADRAARSRDRRPSFYADPVSWLVAQSVRAALDACPEDLVGRADEVAVITVSDHCTLRTMREIAGQVPTGRVSPLRFSGANPGSVGSLPGILLGFQGPSLTLSMPPDTGLPVARAIAHGWLAERAAAYAVVSAHEVSREGRHEVRTTILRAVDPSAPYEEASYA